MGNPARSIALTPIDFDRVTEAVLFVERLSREGVNVQSAGQVDRFLPATSSETVVWPAECTGAEITAEGATEGLYTGKIYRPDPATLTEWVYETVYLMALPDDELVVGERGMARLTGYVFDDEEEDIVGGPVFTFTKLVDTSTSPVGCTGDTGWVHGLLETEVLYMEVPYAAGKCSEISTTQKAYLRWDSGDSKWVSQVWDCETLAWVDYLFVHDTGSGQIKFWVDAGRPRLQIAGVSYDLGFVCGGAGVLVFSGGTPTVCTEGVLAVACGNYFQVKLTCLCSPLLNGWQGAGWYCVVDADGDCEEDDKTVVYLTNPCATGIKICSCRFDTELEAMAACIPPEPSCCLDALPDDLYLRIAASGACADANGLVIRLHRDVMVSTTTWNYHSATGGSGGCVAANITTATFVCTSGALNIGFGADNIATATLTTFACSPFLATYDLSFTHSIEDTCCTGAATATLQTS